MNQSKFTIFFETAAPCIEALRRPLGVRATQAPGGYHLHFDTQQEADDARTVLRDLKPLVDRLFAQPT